jgi:hypothetical protein
VVTGISLAGSWYIRNIILKLFTFGIIYLALWLPAFYKKRMDVF